MESAFRDESIALLVCWFDGHFPRLDTPVRERDTGATAHGGDGVDRSNREREREREHKSEIGTRPPVNLPSLDRRLRRERPPRADPPLITIS